MRRTLSRSEVCLCSCWRLLMILLTPPLSVLQVPACRGRKVRPNPPGLRMQVHFLLRLLRLFAKEMEKTPVPTPRC